MAVSQPATATVVDVKPTQVPTTRRSEKKHITEYPITRSNWYKHVNWLNTTLIVIIPIIGMITALWTPLRLPTAIWAVAYYFWTGLGITAGYHRLWAHTSYSATYPLRLFLAAGGAGAVEGSARWWAAGHRSHHRYTDTDKDPYSVRKGLLYSHLGWMVMKQNPKRNGRVDISDLNDDPIIRFQHKHYLKWVMTFGLILPTVVASLWGDALGGRHPTYLLRSTSHVLREFASPLAGLTALQVLLTQSFGFTALVTLGEGYHNFHHEFPSDYRNAISWWQYDPTKWCIIVWKWMGLAYDLKQFRSNEIEKGRLQQLQKKLDSKRTKLDWGASLEQLPVFEWDDYVEQAKNGRSLIAIAGVVHDVGDFINSHPGGKAMIRSGIGKDATAMFNGGVYRHHNAAHNLLSTMRVGVLRGGMEVEIWKRAARENKDVDHVKDSEGNKIIRAGLQVTRIDEPLEMSTAA